MKNKTSLIATALPLFLWLSIPAFSSTVIPGGNITNQTWTLSGSPYLVMGDIVVPDGTTLTIEAGVIVKFSTTDQLASGADALRCELIVNGMLKSQGTSTNFVVFTSGSSTPSGSDWYGIVIGATGVVEMEKTAIEYCLHNILPDAAGTITGTSPLCAGTEAGTYNVPSIARATKYVWILPDGATGTSTTNSISVSFDYTARSGNIRVFGRNEYGDGPESSFAVTVNSPPAQPESISGNSTVCSGSSSVYSTAEVAGATSYTWTLPSGWTGTSTTSSINTTASTASGEILVTANNTCPSPAQSLSVTVNNTPAQPGPVSGNAEICADVTATYSIDAVGGATSYTWTLPGGWSGTSATNSIDATASATSGEISVTANNGTCVSSASELAVTANSVPAAPGAIAGDASICSGVSTTYSVATVSGATSYTWTLPTGWTGTSTSNSIDATTTATSGDILVTASNICGSSSASTLTVTTTSIPGEPGAISGEPSICSGITTTYSVASVDGATTYTWTLPTGWTGASTSASIDATASGTSGDITVTANNICGSSSASALAVITNTTPAEPGPISGEGLVCSGVTNTYSVPEASGATSYAWMLPDGWTGTSTTNSLEATASTTSGEISVTANNGSCASSASVLAVTANSTPTEPGTISGEASVCSDVINTYSVASVSGATSYTWTLPGGWTGTSMSNSIDATTGTASGDILVTANNGCGSSSATTLNISVTATPSQPEITLADSDATESTLASSSDVGNQWFRNGVAIAGASNSILLVTETGEYTVEVTSNGCTSPRSDPFSITITGLENPGLTSIIKTFPNPATQVITLDLPDYTQSYEAHIYDNSGRLIERVDGLSHKMNINIDKYPSGHYHLIIRGSQRSYRAKFVKE